MKKFALGLALSATLASAASKDECRQPNYITRDGKIYAQDPKSPSDETEITIRGVAWSGMEKEAMIPDGLWGSTSENSRGVLGTKVSTLLQFMTNHSINSVRLPLTAAHIIKDSQPQLAYMHGYENMELTKWNKDTVSYVDLIGRLVQTLGKQRISVLLDIHVLDDLKSQNAYWYDTPFVQVTESPTYKAATILAQTLCNASQWNILGLDLKDAMTGVQWNAAAGDQDEKSDWRKAAQVIANRVLELCPSWLVFVGGASSPTDYQKMTLGKTVSSHWDGGNLKNATKSPLTLSMENKLVFAPQAHSHGRLPQNFFFEAGANCTTKDPEKTFAFEYEQLNTECVDFIDGAKKRSKYPCTNAAFGCASYKHLTPDKIATQYQAVMNEAVGDVLKEGKTPVILGSFSGVYGTQFQPHQTAALDFLFQFAATKLRGGYFWSLNPDTEYFLEDSTNTKASGLFGKTHYGIFSPKSWQEPNADVLLALKQLPSTTIPCYGGKPLKVAGVKSSSIKVSPSTLWSMLLSTLLATFFAL